MPALTPTQGETFRSGSRTWKWVQSLNIWTDQLEIKVGTQDSLPTEKAQFEVSIIQPDSNERLIFLIFTNCWQTSFELLV